VVWPTTLGREQHQDEDIAVENDAWHPATGGATLRLLSASPAASFGFFTELQAAFDHPAHADLQTVARVRTPDRFDAFVARVKSRAVEAVDRAVNVERDLSGKRRLRAAENAARNRKGLFTFMPCHAAYFDALTLGAAQACFGSPTASAEERTGE
jgi:hypothetical protein